MLDFEYSKVELSELTVSAQPQETGSGGVLPILKPLSVEKPVSGIFQKTFLIILMMLYILDRRKPLQYFPSFFLFSC